MYQIILYVIYVQFCGLFVCWTSGISILRGYGFVQYSSEEDARSAVAAKQNFKLEGSRLGERRQGSMSTRFSFSNSFPAGLGNGQGATEIGHYLTPF